MILILVNMRSMNSMSKEIIMSISRVSLTGINRRVWRWIGSRVKGRGNNLCWAVRENRKKRKVWS